MSVIEACEHYEWEHLPYQPPVKEKPGVFVNKKGSFGYTFVTETGRRAKLTQGAVDERGEEEALMTCVADEKGLGAGMFDAWRTRDQRLVMLLEDYPLGDLAEYVKGDPDWDELDVALETLVVALRAGQACHRDLRPDNIVLKRDENGQLIARAVDWYRADALRSCPGHVDMFEIMRVWVGQRAEQLPATFREINPNQDVL